MSPERMRVAEAAHREDRTRRGQGERSPAAKVGGHLRNPPRPCLPFDAEGRGVEMPLGPAIAHHLGAAVTRIAGAIVVDVEEKRAVDEIARSPQPDALAELNLERRLRFARTDGTDAPNSVACPYPSRAVVHYL